MQHLNQLLKGLEFLGCFIFCVSLNYFSVVESLVGPKPLRLWDNTKLLCATESENANPKLHK